MNNLKLLRKRKGVTQQDVADFLGVNRVSYTDFENSKTNIKPEYLLKLAEYFETTIDEILGKSNVDISVRPIVQSPELVFEDEFMLPIVGSLRCGFNYSGEPFQIYKRIPVPKSYASKWGKNIVGLEAIGKSMIPTIRPFDICICVPGSIWEDDNVVVVDINDSDTIKRIRHAKDGGIDLIPDNEIFEVMHFTPEELSLYQVNVLGRVVKIIPPDL